MSREQVWYIYETKTVCFEPTRVDDIIEAVNHFRCFDNVIETYKENYK